VSNATQTSLSATASSPQSYVIFNNTVPRFANRNVSFMVDGELYANKTANSTGFVSFNYTGAWSARTFEWRGFDPDVNKDGSVNVLDLNMIGQSFNQSAAACSNCDVDGNGAINVLDLNIVAQDMDKAA